MEFVQQFQASQVYKLLLPLALAADTLGLYDVVPDPIKQFMSYPLINILLLTMFVLETGADATMTAGFFLVMCFFYAQKHGLLSLIQPKA